MVEAAVNFNHLLIIDDDPSLAKTLSSILTKAGYEVECVATGEQGVDSAMRRGTEEPYGAIMIDLKLPDMNGLDVLRSIKKSNPDAGVIMMTGYSDMETAVSALNEGAFAYIQKPYNVAEVKATIERLIEKQRLMRENKVLLQKMMELNAELENRVSERTQDLQKANLNLAATIDKLREADAAKSDFISRMSHELRTPLTVIIGFVQTTLTQIDKLDKGVLQHYFTIIHAHSVMLSRLIESILDFSRIREKGIQLNYETLNVETLLHEAVEGLKIIRSGIRFEVAVAPNTREFICDKVRVQQLFNNLLGNAIKYSPDKGLVKISTSERGQEIVFRIEDEGPGIPAKEQERIFEPFYRANDTINMKIRGTGLGLTITRAIVQALGGRIWVESQQGKGSAFLFTLPKAAPAAPAQGETRTGGPSRDIAA